MNSSALKNRGTSTFTSHHTNNPLELFYLDPSRSVYARGKDQGKILGICRDLMLMDLGDALKLDPSANSSLTSSEQSQFGPIRQCRMCQVLVINGFRWRRTRLFNTKECLSPR
jgi:hypothetical protein